MKIGIKSFKVPELFIEIPETATVGSLKVWIFLLRNFWKGSFIFLDNDEIFLLALC